MPELPEVETVARRIEPDVLHQTIRAVDLRWARTLATPSAAQFKKQIQGQKVRRVGRRAKYILLELDDYSLMIHLRMSGDLIVRKDIMKPETHDRLLVHFTNGTHLAFNDTRKFGRVWLTNEPQSVLGGLGPEPLEKEFTAKWLFENLQTRNRQIKPLLLDQTFLAGLGNIYTDECLNIAKIHPLKVASSITEDQARALHKAIRAVLKEGIRRNGASIDWAYRGGEFQNHFRVYDREGRPCVTCGTAIKKFTVGQRGTHICPNCQRLR